METTSSIRRMKLASAPYRSLTPVSALAAARAIAASLLIGASLCTLGGCVIAVGSNNYSSDSRARLTKTITIPHEANTALNAATENGSIQLEKALAGDVVITAEIRARSMERAEKTVIEAVRLADRTLSVRVIWPDGRRSSEGASLTIQSPGFAAASVESSNGTIRVAGFAGRIEATTTNGAVSIGEHDGMAVVRSSNGRVTLDHVTGADVTTSNGEVDVALAPDANGPLNIATSNAPVVVEVGGYSGHLTATTSNARVRVDAPGKSIAVERLDGTSAQLAIGTDASSESNASSRSGSIKTSNGTIRIVAK
jgi:hypothetical protein